MVIVSGDIKYLRKYSCGHTFSFIPYFVTWRRVRLLKLTWAFIVKETSDSGFAFPYHETQTQFIYCQDAIRLHIVCLEHQSHSCVYSSEIMVDLLQSRNQFPMMNNLPGWTGVSGFGIFTKDLGYSDQEWGIFCIIRVSVECQGNGCRKVSLVNLVPWVDFGQWQWKTTSNLPNLSCGREYCVFLEKCSNIMQWKTCITRRKHYSATD